MSHKSLSTLLQKYQLTPKKGLGQNFLTDPHHLDKIIAAAEVQPDDTVLEIGPGPGPLTERLLAAAGQVVAIELDERMVHLLRSEFGQQPHLTIIQADILQTNPAEILQALPHPPDSYKVVANLPYYITSAALRHLLESEPRPRRLVVTVQKEVAQRIVAGPGDMSILAVSVQFYGQPALVHQIPAGAFYPPPNVDSAVLRVDCYPTPLLPAAQAALFFRVVKAGFSQKRKQLKNTLSSGLGLPAAQVTSLMEQANIAPRRRAQSLSMAEWQRLVTLLEPHLKSPPGR